MVGDSKICINVRKSLNVRKLTGADWDKEFIQQGAYGRLKDIIDGRMEELSQHKAEADQEDGFLDRRHDAITIHGTRGSGKTTFVLNAIAKLTKDHKTLIDLGILDPTLIGSKENLFLLILNRIKVKIEKKPGIARDGASYQTWAESLKKLAGGLCLLDGVGSDRHLGGDQWEDAHYIMEKGLNEAAAGQGLETNFHRMVGDALAVLGGQAFILALDDIDTNFEQGWQVLETLRRYLTSPRLIIVLSGDMDLYGMLVRGRQWMQFPKKLLENDSAMKGTIGDMVGHLQGQYLQKILPPAHRIDLAMFRSISSAIAVRGRDEKEMEVAGYLREKLEGLTLYKNEGLTDALNLVQRQPIRTIINLLALMDRGDPQALRRGLISQFTDVLARLKTDSDEFYRIRGESFAADLARFLTRNLAWDRAHGLPLDLDNEDLNLGLLVLAALAGGYGTAHALDYMLRICLFREVATHYRPDLLGNPVLLSEAERYLALTRPGSLLEIGRHMTVLLRAEDTSPAKTLRSGTTQVLASYSRVSAEVISSLYGRAYEDPSENCDNSAPEPIRQFRNRISQEADVSRRTHRWLGGWYNTPDDLLVRLTSKVMSGIAGLPFSRILKRAGDQPTYASIHNVLGALADMVAAPDRIEAILQGCGDISSYEIPAFMKPGSPGNPGENDEALEGPVPQAPEIAGHPFVTELREWAVRMAEVRPLPAAVMARVWSRFFKALDNFEESLTADRLYLGYILYRQIILFLNALVVEEAIYSKGYSDQITLRSPLHDDNIFTRNFKNLVDTSSFSAAFTGCPLLAAYLPADALVLVDRYNFSHQIDYKVSSRDEEGVPFDSVYVLLNSIALPGRRVRVSEVAPSKSRAKSSKSSAEERVGGGEKDSSAQPVTEE